MASNYSHEGETMTLVAPYDRTSGQGAKVGSIFGVALVDVLSGASASFATEGVWTLTKVSAQAWTLGEKLYWDDSAKNVTSTSSGNHAIGVAAAVADNPSSTGSVRLNGAW